MTGTLIAEPNADVKPVSDARAGKSHLNGSADVAAKSIINESTPEAHRRVLIDACSKALRHIPVDDDRDKVFKIRLALKLFLGDKGESIYVSWKTEDKRTQAQKQQDILDGVIDPERLEAAKEYQKTRIKIDDDSLSISTLFHYAKEASGYACAFYEMVEPRFSESKLDIVSLDVMKQSVLSGLAILKHYLPSQFRKFREQVLKHKTVQPVRDFDQAVAQKVFDIFGEEDKQVSPVDKMTSDLKLFRTPRNEPYAVVHVNGHTENHAITTDKGDSRLKSWLKNKCYNDFNGYQPKPFELERALEQLQSRALFGRDSPVCDVFLRVGTHEGKYYIDLCDEHWRAVEIDHDGWRVVWNPPIKFIRTDGMLSIPEPLNGGSVDLLREVINADDYNFKLLVSWLLWSMLPIGPYTIASISGPPGSGKTSAAKFLRMLFDDHEALMSSRSKDKTGYFASAKDSWMQVWNNLNKITAEESDTFCVIGEGSGYRAKKLYTDATVMSFHVKRPQIIVAVKDLMDAPDLRSRALFIRLEQPQEFKSEKVLEAVFRAHRPKIVGALLDVLVYGLQHLDTVEDKNTNRFPDFSRFMNACEAKLGWGKGEFDRILADNIKSAAEEIWESSNLATLIHALLGREKGEWKGSMTQLLIAFKELKMSELKLDYDALEFLSNTKRLRNALDEISGVLKENGVYVKFLRDGKRTVLITRNRG